MGNADLTLLSAMITPAVLISACGLLVLSTANRLARIVDRVRTLSRTVATSGVSAERRDHVAAQLELDARRSRLIQHALTGLYVSIGLFVAAALVIGLGGFVTELRGVPTVLGLLGMVVLLYACLSLVHETRLAIVVVDADVQFGLRAAARLAQRLDSPEGGA